MKRLLNLTLLSLIVTTPVIAGEDTIFSSDEAMHAVGHTGATYILTHGTYVVCKRIAGVEHKRACLVTGAAVAATAGIVKEVVLDSGESNKRHFKGYGQDAVGIGLAATLITIDW